MARILLLQRFCVRVRAENADWLSSSTCLPFEIGIPLVGRTEACFAGADESNGGKVMYLTSSVSLICGALSFSFLRRAEEGSRAGAGPKVGTLYKYSSSESSVGIVVIRLDAGDFEI